MEIKRSPFYNQRFSRRFDLPLLAYEMLWGHFTEGDLDPQDEVVVSKIYKEVLITVCGIPNPSKEDLDYFVAKSIEVSKGFKEEDKDKSRPYKRGFSTEFYKMLAETPIYDLVTQMCSYNYKEADRLYSVVDREDTLHFLDIYLTRVKHDQQVLLEACVYGAGGGFGKGSGAVAEHDLTKGGGEELLKKLF